jgi:hypothetical protein
MLCCDAMRGRLISGRTKRQGGVAIVEFSLLAPIAFLILMGLLVLGLVVANQNLLTDGVRDTARAAAVCGGSNRDPKTQLPPPPNSATPTLCEPTSTTTGWANLDAYARLRLNILAGGGLLSAPAPPTGVTSCKALPSSSALVCLYTASGAPATGKDYTGAANPLDDCQLGWKIGISTQEAQPLYMPLVGHVFGNAGSNTRTLTADAEATCEQ